MKKNIPETGALETAILEKNNTRILLVTLAAFAVATLILVTFILPAEFNRDPLGVGQRLGVFGLSDPGLTTVDTVSKEKTVFHNDAISFDLLPFEYVEYKYQMAEGSSLLYSWTASDLVSFDLHGESHDDEGYEESYSMGKDDEQNGSFIAPFNGIHGWFWENRGANTVTVKLSTAGFYSESLEFRDGDVNKKIFGDEQP
jgi:hypothetical protein